jgi:hypothetical protein
MNAKLKRVMNKMKKEKDTMSENEIIHSSREFLGAFTRLKMFNG